MILHSIARRSGRLCLYLFIIRKRNLDLESNRLSSYYLYYHFATKAKKKIHKQHGREISLLLLEWKYPFYNATYSWCADRESPIRLVNDVKQSSSSSGARSGTDIGDHASPNISVIRQLQKI